MCDLSVAGIGYFTLPYLVHAGASHVYACEWNPDAVESLRVNLALNRVEDRCTVLIGDNRQASNCTCSFTENNFLGFVTIAVCNSHTIESCLTLTQWILV